MGYAEHGAPLVRTCVTFVEVDMSVIFVEVDMIRTRYSTWTDDEVLRLAQQDAMSELEIELCRRLNDALDTIDELECKAKTWNDVEQD